MKVRITTTVCRDVSYQDGGVHTQVLEFVYFIFSFAHANSVFHLLPREGLGGTTLVHFSFITCKLFSERCTASCPYARFKGINKTRLLRREPRSCMAEFEVRLAAYLKCIYSTEYSIGNKQQELEATV